MKVKGLFQALHEISKVEIVVDACVGEKTVDMKLMNVPLRIVAEALAAQFGLRYEQDGARLAVTCRED